MTSFGSLPDEIVLKIIKMAAPRIYVELHEAGFQEYHDFLVDVICKVSVRFRRLAKDSSLGTDHIIVIRIPPNDYSKLNFVIQEYLNWGTKTLGIWARPEFCLGNSLGPSIVFPTRHLIDLATKFPNLKKVNLIASIRLEGDIPAPWIIKDDHASFKHLGVGKVLTRD